MLEVINKEAIRRNLVRNLKQILEDRGLTPSDLSRMTGIQVMTVWQNVNGRRLPNIVTIAAIAQSLSVTIDDLISDPHQRVNRPKRKMAGRPHLVETR